MHFYSEKHYGCGDFATFYEALALLKRDKPAAVCKLLDIKPATLQNYLSGKAQPPKAAVRLLFMESYYGQSAVNAHLGNGLTLQHQISNSLRDEVQRLQTILAALEIENAEIKQSGPDGGGMAANSSRWRA